MYHTPKSPGALAVPGLLEHRKRCKTAAVGPDARRLSVAPHRRKDPEIAAALRHGVAVLLEVVQDQIGHLRADLPHHGAAHIAVIPAGAAGAVAVQADGEHIGIRHGLSLHGHGGDPLPHRAGDIVGVGHAHVVVVVVMLHLRLQEAVRHPQGAVVVPGKGSKGKSYAEYHAEKVGTSWKGKLKIAVDTLIPQVASFEELLQRLQAAGYEIKPGKYISCRAPGQERFTRLKTLGADYTEEAIRERIEGKRTKAAKAPKEQRGVSLLIDIENSIKAAQSRGYEQWAKIHNLKLAAKTMNFLTEHKIEQYADLVSRIEEINAENVKTADALKSVEKRLADMAVLMKHVTTYQKTKPIYEAYRRAKDKDTYRAKQESSLILHEAAVKTLKAAGVTKLPNLAAMQEEYGKLQAQKEALYADYGKLKKQVKEYDVIKQNIDSILRQGKEQERGKEIERG